MYLAHLAHNRKEFPEPYVSLLRRRRVEYPLVVSGVQLRKSSRVAVHLTECIGIFVLVHRMEDVDWQAGRLSDVGITYGL